MLPAIETIEAELENSGEVITSESDNDLDALISGLLANQN